jgi:hypothetical protein
MLTLFFILILRPLANLIAVPGRALKVLSLLRRPTVEIAYTMSLLRLRYVLIRNTLQPVIVRRSLYCDGV